MINKSNVKEPMPMLRDEERKTSFKEVELGFSDECAIKEARRCLNCKNKPCVKGCPVNIDIPKFINFVSESKLELAYDVISENNSFPAICGRVCPQEKQCESKCVRGIKGEPVAIGRLERYVADKHIFEENKTQADNKKEKSVNNIERSKYKIAIIGSGPSGLACASELADFGFKVDIFEALHSCGGVLAYGIPEFRLPKSILNYELENLKNKSVDFITNVVIGKSFTVDELFENGYSAVYISTGAGLPRFMNLPGEGLAGIYYANEYLTRVNLMKAYDSHFDTPIQKSKNVVVVGGGNVAMDAARCAKRFSPESVTVVYRRTEEDMPARKEEILHAKQEGINFMFLSNPTEFLGSSGKVETVKCSKMKISKDLESGKNFVGPLNEFFELKADTVIIAIGNESNKIIREENSGINFDEKGRIIVNKETLQTSRNHVYAGGDIVTGAATVILAMGAGKKAAFQIYKDLLNEK